MKFNYYFSILVRMLCAIFFIINIHLNLVKGMTPQDEPVLAPDAITVPTLDGIGNDQCWQNVPWQNIDEVWIPYDGNISQSDYTGKYKVIWSSQTNLLYFLMEVTDDVFIDGFIEGVTADIYNFDICEVFIDEDKSGGEHRYDGMYMGANSNAENAFAYHMYAEFPEEGQVTTEVHVDDMAGTQSNSYRPDYSSHFPEFAMRVKGDTCVREFSLIVYKDTYTEANKDAARSQLADGKVMGLSVAYCDNDNNDGYRDNMFGSVWEPSPGNLHWQNADYFGTVKLVNDPTSVSENKFPVRVSSAKIYPNPASTFTQLQLNDPYRGEVSIKLYNLLGQEVSHSVIAKNEQFINQKLLLNNLSSGIYFIQTQMGKSVNCDKLIISNRK
jgi:hypothetical protein